MDFVDQDWEDVAASFVKENILGSEFSFSTKSELTISIDYIPKTQARKLYTFAKEQMDNLKNVTSATPPIQASIEEVTEEGIEEEIEEMETEEVTHFAEIVPISPPEYNTETFQETTDFKKEKALTDLSQDELFEKLQNYKKLLDNGLILQGEYDAYKKEILSYM